MKHNLSIVVSSFGSACDPYIDSLKNSVRSIYPNVSINVIGKDTPTDENRINKLMDEIKFVKESPGSLKIICWNQGLKMADTEWVLFLDNDTLLLKDIDCFIEMADEKRADFIFTWRHSFPQWVNTGVMLVRKNKKTIKFFEDYENKMIDDIRKNRNDQETFVSLLKISDSHRLSTMPREQILGFTTRETCFLGIHCDYLNRSDGMSEWFAGTFIQHLKGVQNIIITKDEKFGGTFVYDDGTERQVNRYVYFTEFQIYKHSISEIRNLNHRIKLWKKFANLKYSKDVIDLEEYINSPIAIAQRKRWEKYMEDISQWPLPKREMPSVKTTTD